MTLIAVVGSMSLLYADSSEVDTAATAKVSAPASSGLSLVEMQTRGKQLGERVFSDARHVLHLQAIARKEKDVIKLNCVNDKLVQLKPQHNIVERANNALANATDDNRFGLYDELYEAAESVRRLREEADRCIGDSLLTGESSNQWTGPDVPDNPFTDGPYEDVEPPAYASPFN